MAKLTLTREQNLKFQMAKRILGIFEIGLAEEGFELLVEGENIFIRTSDEQNVFRLVDKSVGGNLHLRDSVTLIPRTTDSQDLVPVLIDGKEPEWV